MLIKKEQDIAEVDLPQAIRDVNKSKYANYRIDDVKMTWLDNSNTFKVEQEKGKEEWEITFDATEKVLREGRD